MKCIKCGKATTSPHEPICTACNDAIYDKWIKDGVIK